MTNCLNDRVAQLKASHEWELKLEIENASLKASLRQSECEKVFMKESLCQSECENAILKESLCRIDHEKDELQRALDGAEGTLSDALFGLKKSRPSKSRVSPSKPDKRQRKLSSENGTLSISKAPSS